VGRSESWLSQVERGILAVDQLSVLVDLARVLHVQVEALTGRPWQHAPIGGEVVESVDGVRQFFSRYDHLLGAEPPAPLPQHELNERVAAAHAAYQAARYGDVIAGLPGLLAAVEGSRRSAAPAGRRDLLLGYASAYVVAAKLLTKLGAADLAIVAADRCATAAADADSLSARGLAAYQIVCALLRAGRSDEAERLAVGMAELAQREARGDRPLIVSAAGALWLIAAIVAARRADRGEAWRRLGYAESLSGLLAADANFGWTAFGPTNVAIHRVSVAAELGDTGEALRAAAAVDLSRLPEGLSSRRAQVHLDLAWAQAQRRRDAEAILHLLEAERVAPEAPRHNAMAREIVRQMLARGGRQPKTSALHDLAVRAGVLAEGGGGP
jgi:tetratricopeptide (TPR) repeat protein